MTGSMDTKRIFYAVDDYWGCGWYRCHVPGLALKRLGHQVILDQTMTPEQVHWSDVIVFQRQWQPDAVRAFQYARSLGKFLVYELDDDLWHMDASNPGYRHWSKPEPLRAVETLAGMADVVTTTTPLLANELRRLNKNVRVLPNMLPSEHWQLERERPAGYDRVVVGWAGSSHRTRDLSVVKDVVLQLLDTYPHLEFVIAGDESNIAVFPPHDRIRWTPPVRIESLAQSLAEFDIGVAPIVDNRFNQAKSDLKFLEYGALGIPAVASHVEAYSRTIVNGENGYLAKNPKDWLKYLGRLIEDSALRERMGAAAKAVAEGRTIEKNVERWERAYGFGEAAKKAG